MKLSVIINTFNEGGRVAATCRDFLSAGADEVVVCADGTTDSSCDSLPPGTHVVRHAKPLGCGKAKIAATAAATGDVMLWVDAHQNVLQGDIRAMASTAASSGAVVVPPIGNIAYDVSWVASRLQGSTRSFYPNNAAILPFCSAQYRHTAEPSMMMVGVGLCMSRETYNRIGGWNAFLGRHGSQERGMALRAYMAGIPIVCAENILIGHEFFGPNHPSRNSATGSYRFNNNVPAWKNAWHSYYAVCGKAVFRDRIVPWMNRCGCGPKGTTESTGLTSEAMSDHNVFERVAKRRTDDELIAMLETLSAQTQFPLGSECAGVPVTGMHNFVPVLKRWLDFIKPTSVLEWGPGVSSKVILDSLPSNGQLTSIEHNAAWLSKAKASIGDPKAKWVCHLESVSQRVSRYAHRALEVAPRPQLVLIDGRRRVECAMAAMKALEPGGVILMHDSGRVAYTDLLRGHIRVISDKSNTLVFTPIDHPPVSNALDKAKS